LDGKRPTYLKLYFYDLCHEVEAKAGIYTDVRADVVAQMNYIFQENPYSKIFRSLRDHVIYDATTITISQNSLQNQRTYNSTSSSELPKTRVDSPQIGAQHSAHVLTHGKLNNSHQMKHYYVAMILCNTHFFPLDITVSVLASKKKSMNI